MFLFFDIFMKFDHTFGKLGHIVCAVHITQRHLLSEQFVISFW